MIFFQRRSRRGDRSITEEGSKTLRCTCVRPGEDNHWGETREGRIPTPTG